MKKVAVYILLAFLCSVKLYAQDVCQQTMMEIDDLLDGSRSYLYQATASIELLPGFAYQPTKSNEMRLDVDRFAVYPPSDGLYVENGGDECVAAYTLLSYLMYLLITSTTVS